MEAALDHLVIEMDEYDRNGHKGHSNKEGDEDENEDERDVTKRRTARSRMMTTIDRPPGVPHSTL